MKFNIHSFCVIIITLLSDPNKDSFVVVAAAFVLVYIVNVDPGHHTTILWFNSLRQLHIEFISTVWIYCSNPPPHYHHPLRTNKAACKIDFCGSINAFYFLMFIRLVGCWIGGDWQTNQLSTGVTFNCWISTSNIRSGLLSIYGYRVKWSRSTLYVVFVGYKGVNSWSQPLVMRCNCWRTLRGHRKYSS